MMSEEELMRDLLNTFHTEAAEHIQTLNQSLLQLERGPEPEETQELLQEAFRAAHSLKGAARAVSLDDVESIAHLLENVLQQARDTGMQLDADTCDQLYNALDAIQALLEGQEVDTWTVSAKLNAIVEGQEADPLMEMAQPEEQPEPQPVEKPEPQPERAEAAHSPLNQDTIRVTIEKLDDLMAQAGELVTIRLGAEKRLDDMRDVRRKIEAWPKMWRQINELLANVNGDAGRRLNELLAAHYENLQDVAGQIVEVDKFLATDTTNLGVVANNLQEEIRRVRMVPFQTIVLPLQRAVRDAARTEGKDVAFDVEGSETELDKKILESLKDPLMHLLRNAVGHGIEAPDVRRRAGKPEQGTVTVAVSQHGSEVHIDVSDDGRGFDLRALREAGIRSGQITSEDSVSDDELIGLAFRPGVSTAAHITEMSGRGVGLDVVRQSLESLQGRIMWKNRAGAGVNFQLQVPASLAVTQVLTVRVGPEFYALPLLAIEKIEDAGEGFNVEGQTMIAFDETPIPLVSLGAVLERPLFEDETSEKPVVVVMQVSGQRMGFMVDDVLSQQELVIKPLTKPLRRVRNVEGTAMLGSGEPIVVLKASDLIRSAKGAPVRVAPRIRKQEETVEAHHHILVVDDSITTRTLEKNILETAGYYVTTATDGTEAIERLKENSVDIVVSDIQMPHMDGFKLVENLRASRDHAEMPIILVTSLESREDRERGAEVGADAYIVKRGFDQAELLATIRQFL
jgi:two-component system chemotaxis sensor kinase CheA